MPPVKIFLHTSLTETTISQIFSRTALTASAFAGRKISLFINAQKNFKAVFFIQ